jgi:hypothetical protein
MSLCMLMELLFPRHLSKAKNEVARGCHTSSDPCVSSEVAAESFASSRHVPSYTEFVHNNPICPTSKRALMFQDIEITLT